MMPAPMFGRVAAVLAPLVTFLVTFLVAQQLPMLTRALGQSVPPTQVVRRELRIGAPGVPSALDPGAALEGTSPLIARQVFDTLVAWREGRTEVEPALATRWNVSRDGLVWSFTLREGVKFHDGSPLTALEVAASFERQLRPETQGTNKTWPLLLRGAPGVVKAVRVPNSRTVEIVLVQPYAPLLTVLAHPALAIAKPSQAADAPGRLIGTGPYRVVDASVGRLALEAAAVPLQSFLPPGVWGRREGSPILGGSRNTVKALIKESKWPKETKPTLLVPAETAPLNLLKLAETIQLLLGSDDLPLNIQAEPEATARSLMQAGAFDMALTEATVAGGDPHLLLYPLSASEAATKGPRAVNFSFYRNQRLDDVLIRASQLSFRSERQRLYQRGQAMLAEELPWLPIYVRLQWAMARSDVRGLRLHPTGIHRLDTVSLEIPPSVAPAPGATR